MRALMRSKSSMSSATPASRAIASRCSTALVDPPVAATDAIAFSIDVAGDDLTRPQLAADHIHRRARRLRGRPRLLRLDRPGRAAADRRDAEELADGRHRVGGELAAARAGAGAG